MHVSFKLHLRQLPFIGTRSPSASTTVGSTTTASTSATSSSSGTGTTTSSTGTSSSTPAAGNPFTGYTVRSLVDLLQNVLTKDSQVFLSPYYANEVVAGAGNITDATLQAKAASVANIPTFIWMDSVSKVPSLGTYLANASALGQASGSKYLVPIVVYDLPDRDCAAYASNGEFSIADNGQADYFNYIDQIVAQVKREFDHSLFVLFLTWLTEYPDVRVVAVVEPDSLANLVTNLSVQKCANAQTTYLACVTYAMQQLSSVVRLLCF